jgi:hypothetical protein
MSSTAACLAPTCFISDFLSAPSPLEGEGWGGGYSEYNLTPRNSLAHCVLPPSQSAARIDLPLRRGGENIWQRAPDGQYVVLKDTKDGTTWEVAR